MALRFFTDHCVPSSIIQAIRDAGYEVLLLKDHIPTEASDEVVISKAQELDAILVSLNGDFSDIANYPPAQYKGIIALQVRNHPEIIPQLISRLKDFLSSHADMKYFAGKLFLVEAHRIRIRIQ
ncbi:MAG: DUF5615 family PIN-like protein [Deltaproteobacteria bacterium]|nr:DUF5615 family PIN-like protein [Deltaproteobacteria bacterium]